MGPQCTEAAAEGTVAVDELFGLTREFERNVPAVAAASDHTKSSLDNCKGRRVQILVILEGASMTRFCTSPKI